jgi:predicted dithiol-disulfide oxidoreductase (DUF899 family)
MADLESAKALAERASKPYPNDSAEYRAARTALLAEEIELRRHIGRVAAERRALPPGGEIAQDYELGDEQGRSVRFSDLFGAHDTLVTYFWMFGPERERPCPMCTSFVGSLDIPAPDITQRVALAVIGRSPVERQLAFARERGWRNLRFYVASDDFARDYRGLAPNGDEWASFDVWTKKDGIVRHFWGASESSGTADPGQDAHLAPDPTPLWNLLDLTPGGRGTDWYPSLAYED